MKVEAASGIKDPGVTTKRIKEPPNRFRTPEPQREPPIRDPGVTEPRAPLAPEREPERRES